MSTVAIAGFNGALGKPTLDALTSDAFYSQIKGPVIVLTRDPSKVSKDSYNADRAIFKQASGPEDWDETLKSTDVFINLVGPQNLDAVETALKRNPPKVYIPSQFGVDVGAVLTWLPVAVFRGKQQHSEKVRALGVRVIDVYTGLFDNAFFLNQNIGSAGYDEATNSVTYIGGPTTKVSTSKTADIGKALAVISIDPSKVPDEVRVFSNTVTQEQIVQRYEKANNVKISVNPTPDFNEEVAKAIDLAKNEKGFDLGNLFYFLRVIAGAGAGKGLLYEEKDREVVNPGEKFYSYTPF